VTNVDRTWCMACIRAQHSLWTCTVQRAATVTHRVHQRQRLALAARLRCRSPEGHTGDPGLHSATRGCGVHRIRHQSITARRRSSNIPRRSRMRSVPSVSFARTRSDLPSVLTGSVLAVARLAGTSSACSGCSMESETRATPIRLVARVPGCSVCGPCGPCRPDSTACCAPTPMCQPMPELVGRFHGHDDQHGVPHLLVRVPRISGGIADRACDQSCATVSPHSRRRRYDRAVP